MTKVKTLNRSNLVGEWKLDGNWNDSSGNGYNWTVSNVTYVSTDRGYQSQAGRFTASNAQVSLNNNALFASSNFSLFAWVKPTSSSYWAAQYVFFAQSGWYQLVYVRFSNGSWISKLNFITGTGANYSDTGADLYGIPTSAISVDQWHLVWFTQNGTTINQYLDGQLYSSYTSTGAFATFNGSPNVKIGAYTGGAEPLADIQDVRIYNTAIDQNEIQSLYLEWLRRLSGSSLTPLIDWLVAYWDFNGDVTQDVVGWYTLTNNWAVALWTDRLWGLRAADFTSTNTSKKLNRDWDNLWIDTTASNSFNVWVNQYTDWWNGNTVFFLGSLTGKWHFAIIYDKNTWSWGTNKLLFWRNRNGVWSDIAYYTTTLSTGTWYMLSLVYNGSTIYWYINGQQVVSTSSSWAGSSNDYWNVFNIWCWWWNWFGDYYLDSWLVSDMTIFKWKALSDSEILALYNLSSQRYLIPLLY